mmetsp:Transcript_10826/g.35570  ORF Transcript_10826/g.35570 Transcript_10826/m.35570 type:complete len:223 (-) Transcript_10826:245-913(-)
MPGTGLPVVSSRQRVHVRQRERIDSRFSGAHSPLAALVEELERGFMSAAFAARARSCATRRRPWRRSSRDTESSATLDGCAACELCTTNATRPSATAPAASAAIAPAALSKSTNATAAAPPMLNPASSSRASASSSAGRRGDSAATAGTSCSGARFRFLLVRTCGTGPPRALAGAAPCSPRAQAARKSLTIAAFRFLSCTCGAVTWTTIFFSAFISTHSTAG